MSECGPAILVTTECKQWKDNNSIMKDFRLNKNLCTNTLKGEKSQNKSNA